MKELFWISAALIAYTYAGYSVWLWLVSLVCKRPVHGLAQFPSVSIIIAARNEECLLQRKLANLGQLRYNRELLQIIIASDGSTDTTAQILVSNADHVRPVILPQHQGKAVALNEAVNLATGEILVFFDVRQHVDPDALEQLVKPFSDATIGAVSGDLRISDESGLRRNAGLGQYWQLEKQIRALESASGSMIGATGSIYAIRRELYTSIPKGTILDDVFIPMNVAQQGKRVIFESRAIAWDAFSAKSREEFARKVRTLTGNFQLVAIAPWLLSTKNPLLFRFISHKVLRLSSPFLLLFIFLASAGSNHPIYRAAFWLQLIFYACAVFATLIPAMRKVRIMALVQTFASLNLAALIAFLNFATRRNSVWR